MMYTPKLQPTRGFMIEKAQPFTKYDLELAKQILAEKDELVIGVGGAGESHELGLIMTGGERVEHVDAVLRAEGIDPNRYMIVPVENAPEATQWVGEVLMVTPRWDTLYTRNYKNATMFEKFQRDHNFTIRTIKEQKPEVDYFRLAASVLDGSHKATNELREHITDSATASMRDLGIDDRVNVIYNRTSPTWVAPERVDRILFLGGLQPPTGVYEHCTGHVGVIKQALTKRSQVVIAVGSAQQSLMDSDPFTGGERIDLLRYTLQANGVNAAQFYIVPIKDIQANACFPIKVVGMCPAFDAAIAGNDYTKHSFGKGKCEMVPIVRGTSYQSEKPLSGSAVRRDWTTTSMEHNPKGMPFNPATIPHIRAALEHRLDPALMDKMQAIGAYETMHFLAYAKE
jgi:nicotinamide-nucleotide adenylyltransferase